MTASYNFLQDTVKQNDGLFLIFTILVMLIAFFVMAINIARIKKVFFKLAKTRRVRLYTYKLIRFYVKYRRIIWYVLFGCCTTVITIFFKNVFHYIFSSQHPYLSAEIAWLIATIFSFITNKYFVFKSIGAPKIVVFYESLTFFGARIISLLIDFAIIYFMYVLLNINYSLVSIISITIQIIINYFMVTHIVFNDKVKGMFENSQPRRKRKKFIELKPIVSADEFIPTFSKDDDFLKYLSNEGFN